MNAIDVIEAYVDDIVRLLPWRQRDDVAAELRALLNEELHARGQESGRLPDESLALSLVRGYGRPNEVAARYQPRLGHHRPRRLQEFRESGDHWGGCPARAQGTNQAGCPRCRGSPTTWSRSGSWPGSASWSSLFGAKNWIRWRWPATAVWKPRDRDRVNRVGTAVLVPIAMFIVVLYGAPTWVLDRISSGRFDTSWAAYTADFQRLRLPGFIGLMVGLLALLSFVAIQGRWRRLTRRINIGLNMALACLILSFAVEGNIFQSSLVDQIARNVLALVAVIYVPSVGVQLYGEIGRIDRPAAPKKA